MVDINISNLVTVGLLAVVFWILVNWVLRMFGQKVPYSANGA